MSPRSTPEQASQGVSRALAKFFFCVLFLTSSREIKTQNNNNNNKKKKTRPIFGQLDWTSLVNKWFIIWLNWRTFACGTSAGNPERARWPHLARSGGQSECMIIRFILPACEFSHVKRNFLFIHVWNIANPTENYSLLLNTVGRLFSLSKMVDLLWQLSC